jgi:PAS domain S-box-containing protein
MGKALETSLRIIQESCRGDFIWALAPDEAGNLRVKTGAGPLKAGDIAYTSGTGSLELHAIASRETVRVKGIVSEPAFHLHESLRTFNTAYAIPIWVGEKTFGAFAIYYSVMRTLTDEELHFLQTVASILAVAFERESLYQNVMIERGRSDAILAGIADGVLTTDIAGRVLSANDAALTILGGSAEDVRGRPVTEVLVADVDPAAFALRVESCLAEALAGEVSTVEGHIAGGQGQRIPLVLRSAPVRDDRGTNAGVVFVLRNMSREIELDAMKTDFIRSVSHEFRTPLTAIVGMAEMVLDAEVAGERLMEYVGSIHREGLRLSEMVTDVLDIARIESGKEIFRESEIDFPAILRAVREGFAAAIEKKEIAYSDHCAPGLGTFRGDREKLTRLLSILVDNAVTYSEPGSPVSVSIDRSDVGVLLTVRDSGWGMSDDDLRHAGERFYRGRRASKTKGTGLGLALARDIARLHGGEITIDSAPDRGTIVTVKLGERKTP